MAEIKLEDLNISLRTYSALKSIGLNHLHELSLYFEDDFEKFRNISDKSLREIKAEMVVYGIWFRIPEKKNLPNIKLP